MDVPSRFTIGFIAAPVQPYPIVVILSLQIIYSNKPGPDRSARTPAEIPEAGTTCRYRRGNTLTRHAYFPGYPLHPGLGGGNIAVKGGYAHHPTMHFLCRNITVAPADRGIGEISKQVTAAI